MKGNYMYCNECMYPGYGYLIVIYWRLAASPALQHCSDKLYPIFMSSSLAMATEAPYNEPGPSYDQEVDEMSIATSLARLQEMHVAVCPSTHFPLVLGHS